MKKHLILIIVLCFAATLQLKAQKEYTVSSPNGTLELKIITEVLSLTKYFPAERRSLKSLHCNGGREESAANWF